jgi:phosphoribosylglycinamide formyltransferase-1
MKRIVVLLSGRGSNLQALIDAGNRLASSANFQVVAAISDRIDAPGLARAEAERIPAIAVARSLFPSRASFEARLSQVIESFTPDFIVMAGFMRVLSADFVNALGARGFNIHPSLLPDYPGLNTHARALADGVRLHGASFHLVTPELDAGPVLSQVELAIDECDDAERLAERLLSREHELLIASVALLSTGRVRIQQSGFSVDNVLLTQPMRLSHDNALALPSGQFFSCKY